MNDQDRYDRQTRVFGPELQQRFRSTRVGMGGLGGLGSIMAEGLARLGVEDFTLIDPDNADMTSLNRLQGCTERDARRGTAKVVIAARNIKSINHRARVRKYHESVFEPASQKALTHTDLIIAATDNHASRLQLNALSCQYMIPIVHVGVHLQLGDETPDISGEYAIPELGKWCLLCAGIISQKHASFDLATPEQRAALIERGYLSGVPSPAVYHLNMTTASLAVAEIHNMVLAHKPIRRYVVYRAIEGDLLTMRVNGDPDCLHCGARGLRGLGDLAPVWTPGRPS